ncbi:MAG TPA: GDP-mannose 4,6-dehydratase [Anaerolineaceae bacterium]|nr:GDP-mannose 4,6-dehydratase [Anaerolineaceae bacterium]HOV07113.1 GDP-mannose 4,6-dehydratase [Anaerolineaceae bacterium]
MAGYTLITGGAGFIGSNYAARCLARGEKVVIFDNLSRRGADRNIEWLSDRFDRKAFELIREDIRNVTAIQDAAKGADKILHLAAQVAVTTSVTDPRTDFEINAGGTFNALEAARLSGRKPAFLYASTNKVYGGMEDVEVVELQTRYDYKDLPNGASELQPLDFHSPYGCSKGSGDQYVRDYHRIYDLPTIVFRQSCIYGTRQFGVEDQGWLAWFLIAAITGRPITIYGNGKQVRDVLFIEDLLDAYDAAFTHLDQSAGQVFNIGGGRENSISVWAEFGSLLENMLGKPIRTKNRDWRPGDQPVFISDIRKANDLLKWTPKVKLEQGIRRLYDWVKENQNLFS